MSQSQAQLSDVFQALLQALGDNAEANARAAATPGATRSQFFLPPGLTGSLFDLPGLSSVFSREELSEQFQRAVADAGSPGVVGDLIAVLLQGDFIATAERAFRSRHTTSVRDKLLASGRLRGHGHEYGVVRRALPAYLQQILQLAAG